MPSSWIWRRRIVAARWLLRTPKNEIQLLSDGIRNGKTLLLYPFSVWQFRQRKLFKIVEGKNGRVGTNGKKCVVAFLRSFRCVLLSQIASARSVMHACARKSKLFELMFTFDWWQCCRRFSLAICNFLLLIYFLVLFLWPSPRFVCFDLVLSCRFFFSSPAHSHPHERRLLCCHHKIVDDYRFAHCKLHLQSNATCSRELVIFRSRRLYEKKTKSTTSIHQLCKHFLSQVSQHHRPPGKFSAFFPRNFIYAICSIQFSTTWADVDLLTVSTR